MLEPLERREILVAAMAVALEQMEETVALLAGAGVVVALVAQKQEELGLGASADSGRSEEGPWE